MTIRLLSVTALIMSVIGCATPTVVERPPVETSLGIDIQAPPHVRTALSAVFDGDLDTFSAEVSRTRDARLRLRDGLTYLHYAADTGQPEFVAYLIELEATVDAQDRVYGFAPIHYAVMRDSAEVVQLLLSKGAKPSIRDQAKWQPIHHAAARGSVPVLDALIRGGGRGGMRLRQWPTTHTPRRHSGAHGDHRVSVGRRHGYQYADQSRKAYAVAFRRSGGKSGYNRAPVVARGGYRGRQ